MPLSSNSRYFNLPVFDAPHTDGTEHPTVAMRLSPDTPTPVVYQHTVTALETLEYLSWRCYHASDSWWRIADTNPLIFPLDWRAGDVVTLPVGSRKGLIARTRRF